MPRHTPHGIPLLEGSDHIHELDNLINAGFLHIDHLLTDAFTRERASLIRPGEVAFDNFARADAAAPGQAVTGQEWDVAAGELHLKGGVLVNGLRDTECLGVVDVGVSNYVVSANLRYSEPAGVGILVAFRDRRSWTAVLLTRTRNKEKKAQIILYERNGDAVNALRAYDVPHVPGAWHNVQVIKTGYFVRMLIDGEFVGRFGLKRNHDARKVGLRFIGPAGTQQARSFTVQAR